MIRQVCAMRAVRKCRSKIFADTFPAPLAFRCSRCQACCEARIYVNLCPRQSFLKFHDLLDLYQKPAADFLFVRL